jgi:hypothetical protein
MNDVGVGDGPQARALKRAPDGLRGLTAASHSNLGSPLSSPSGRNDHLPDTRNVQGTLILHSRITARNSVNAAARPYAVPVKLKALLSAVAHAIPEFI